MMNSIVNKRISLNITALNGEDHQAHDEFIYSYLTNEMNLNEDQILIETKKLLVAQNDCKPQIVKFVTFCYQNYEKRKHLKNKHRLALYILLNYFPESWKSICDNAYILLIELLHAIVDDLGHSFYTKHNRILLIFPQCWTRNIFRLENILYPEEVKGVLFGIDPLPYTMPGCTYTGHAFCFNVPDDCEINTNSMVGLRVGYSLSNKISLTNATAFEDQFVRKFGLALINFIRMIPEDSFAGSGNFCFKEPWAKFHYAWLEKGVSITAWDASRRVLIFENPNYPFDGYCGDNVGWLLRYVPPCIHPSRIIECSFNHCLKYVNASVIRFKDFMTIHHNAATALHCH